MKYEWTKVWPRALSKHSNSTYNILKDLNLLRILSLFLFLFIHFYQSEILYSKRFFHCHEIKSQGRVDKFHRLFDLLLLIHYEKFDRHTWRWIKSQWDAKNQLSTENTFSSIKRSGTSAAAKLRVTTQPVSQLDWNSHDQELRWKLSVCVLWLWPFTSIVSAK